MQINKREILVKASTIVAVLIVILLLILGVKSSKFAQIKKYDEQDKSPRDMMSKLTRSTGTIYNGMQVTIKNDEIANLGDFTFNIAGDKKLIANISMKYQPNKEEDSWINDKDEIKEEILKKSVMLRDAAIDTMLGNSVGTANDDTMRKALKDTLNKNLEKGEVVEVYFNKFIIQ